MSTELHDGLKKLLKNYINAKTEFLMQEKIRLQEELDRAKGDIIILNKKLEKYAGQRN